MILLCMRRFLVKAHGKLSFLYCIENNNAFILTNSGKSFFFIVTGSS